MSPLLQAWLNIVVILVVVMGSSAMLTWVERRLLAVWQDRYGPNRVGPFGILQIVADAIKMLMKEDWVPPFADRAVFVLAPVVIVVTTLIAFAVVPIAPGIGVVDMNIGLLFILAMSSLGVYTIVLAQHGLWYCIPQFVGLLTFAVAGIAETRRLPFDLPEAENELVAGFHTEYSGMKFGLFYIGEYIGVILISALIVTLFFGGWLGPWLPPLVWFLIKTGIVVAVFILMRGSLPRPRYDQLMSYGWKLMLPLTLLNLVVTGAVVLATR